MQTKGSGSGGGSWMAFVAGFLLLQGVGWWLFPALLYGTKSQPMQFSHKVHTGDAGLSCEDCHFFRDDGTFSGIPRIDKCKECHESQIGEHPEEAKLVKDYIEKNREIPWLVYAQQPDCVYFPHAMHVKLGELECKTCHGTHGETDKLRPYQYNRLTKYSRDIWGKQISGIYAFKKNTWDSMKMDDCGTCHSEKHVSRACFVCHK